MQACKSHLEQHNPLKITPWCSCHLELTVLMEPFRGLGTEILLSQWSVLLEMSWEEGFFKLFIIRNQTISFLSTFGGANENTALAPSPRLLLSSALF